MSLPLNHVVVDGVRLAYRSAGSGDPIVFLHGNPTSSYLWRGVLGPVSAYGRCVAPDLVGMGDSEPVPLPGPQSYRFEEHQHYLDGLMALLGLTRRIVLVGHDWGGVLAMDWARRHADAVRGVAYLETHVTPMTWDDAHAPDRDVFSRLRGPEGERLVLEENLFVETLLPSGMRHHLTEDELATYRQPYVEPGESRRPTLTWPREIPIEGEPADVVAVIEANAAWMRATPVPKLFVNGDPGAVLTGRAREECRRWPAQREVTVPGTHFLPEDSAPQIAAALTDWLRDLP